MATTEHSRNKYALVAEEFVIRFGPTPRMFRAPGRVNLIGEHTDYNDGFVMPAAIERETIVAAARRRDSSLRVYSQKFAEWREWPLDEIVPGPTGHWGDYVRGVAGVLKSRGYAVGGADLMVCSDVPVGSGLSSSAAIEVATAYALAEISGLKISRKDLALICQQVEHEYAGARCGIMDQFISANGHTGHALLLDCRSLAYDYVPIPAAVRIVICDSRVKHAVSGGEYNERRSACEAGVAHLRRSLPSIKALRDVTPVDLEKHKAGMPETIYRRCRHVVGEIARTTAAAEALKRHDLAQFGARMYESHQSLRDDYEVSCTELDLLVELARTIPGVYGARMTGAGFGGCTVNLVEASAVHEFRAAIVNRYQRETGTEPHIYITAAADGAGEVGANLA